jgi:hypothetical protein
MGNGRIKTCPLCGKPDYTHHAQKIPTAWVAMNVGTGARNAKGRCPNEP